MTATLHSLTETHVGALPLGKKFLMVISTDGESVPSCALALLEPGKLFGLSAGGEVDVPVVTGGTGGLTATDVRVLIGLATETNLDLALLAKVATNDARLSDARTPTAHSGHAISDTNGLQSALDSKQAAGSYASSAVDGMAGTGTLRTLGAGATAACPGNDARLADARTPTSHAASHAPGGTDAVVPTITTSVPATGQTTTLNVTKNNQLHALLHTSTIAAHTLVFPTDANSAIGQELRVFAKSIVTTMTLTLNGNTIHGVALTTMTAGGNACWRKISASTWARIGT